MSTDDKDRKPESKATHKKESVIKFLLPSDRELTPYEREEFGDRLVSMVKARDLEKMRELISAGVNVNYQDKPMGATALHYAAAYSIHSALVMLIRSGRCDYLIRDKRGMYPSEVAYEIADDPRAGAILAKKEARQAQKTGVEAWPKPG